jgi:hypothetical protein
MREPSKLQSQQVFRADDDSGCRIETQGGTVYWVSEADEDGVRWIVREHLKSSNTNTMVLQRFSKRSELDLGDKFRGKLAGEVEVGKPFVLEVADRDTRILSEPVVAIEAGPIPEMLF